MTYADVVAFEKEGLDRRVLARDEPEYLVVAAVPLDRVQPLVLQGERALEHRAVPLLDGGRDVDPQVAQAPGRNWKREEKKRL